MSTDKHILFNLLFVCGTLAACSSDTFVSHCGNMPTEERIAQLQKGQTKDEVLSLLGTPSSIVSLDQNTWIYMSSEIKRVAFFKPEELNRDVLTIRFNQYNQVSEIDRLNKEQGQNLAINETQTETQGSQAGFFEKYFGGVGQFLPFGKATSSEINK
ncbi:MAG: outer membrane protein assembly factor BamE [Alphaproteobacteria bacterium]|nr:outer membrane protein assembly factor BamE [Alphaproteobacteria bacterium]